MLSRLRLALCLFLFGAALADAAQVTLANGDQVSGTLVRVEGGRLLLETAYAGEISLDFQQVRRLTSEESHSVRLVSGESLQGALRDVDDGWIGVQTSEGVRVVALEMIGAINVALRARWERRVELGGMLASGNSELLAAGAGLRVTRQGDRSRWSGWLRVAYGDEKGERSVNEQRAGLRGEWVRDRWYLFGLLDLERDEFERIDLRGSVASGAGIKVVDGGRWRVGLELSPAATVVRPRKGRDRDDLEVRAAVAATFEVSNRARIRGEYETWWTAGESEYRVATMTTLESRLTESWSVDMSLVSQSNSDPLPGVRRNDLQIRVGLVVSV